MDKIYTEQEKKEILEELNIHPTHGMINSKQVAAIWTKRSEIEHGHRHEYDDNSVRWRVKSKDKTLKPAMVVHKRTNLFDVDDAFAIKLTPGKGPEKGTKRRPKKAEAI